MLTPRQVAERIGVSVSLVYQWCKQGLLEHSRFGQAGRRGRVLIDPESLEQFLESCKQKPKTVLSLRHIQL